MLPMKIQFEINKHVQLKNLHLLPATKTIALRGYLATHVLKNYF